MTDKLNDAEIAELAMMDEMFRRHKMREEEARISLMTHDTKDVFPSANLSKEENKNINNVYHKQAASNRQAIFADMYTSLNRNMEGEVNNWYNPGGKSGWTIGQGIDIAHTSRDEAIKLGVPTIMIELADKHKAWGKIGKPVPKTVQKAAYDTNSQEWQTFNRNVANLKAPIMEKIAKTNPDLSTRAVVTLAQMDHWTGGIFNRTEQASKLNRSELSLTSDGRRTSATENLINPVAELLESGSATDDGLREVIGLINKSYGTKRPLNSTTLQRYDKYLTTGQP